MADEIERRFLVIPSKLPKLDEGLGLTQFYLGLDPWVRVRFSDTAAWITIKGRGTILRPEFEYEIPVRDAQAMLPMCLGLLNKIRYRIGRWDVDEYLSVGLKGLWLAEIELQSVEETFELPPWVSREVTEDVRFTNAELAISGWPEDIAIWKPHE